MAKKPNPIATTIAAITQIVPAAYVAITGQAPNWIRIWIGVWIVLWLLMVTITSELN